MASISRDSVGNCRLILRKAGGKPNVIRLGWLPAKMLRNLRPKLDALVAAHAAKLPLDEETASWLGELDSKLYDKLAAAGLVPEREPGKSLALEAYLHDWLAKRCDYKVASRCSWQQVIDRMREHFGDRPLAKIDRDAAESFRQSMIRSGLRPTTIHKRLQHARMMFGHAVERGLIEKNPFATVRHRPGDVSERRQYIPEGDILHLLRYLPNTTWKLLVVLARFAGLRTPSEPFSLKWSDVDWERNRIVVPTPKSEHLPGREHRVIPIFPEVRPWLEKAFEEAPEGAVYVIPEAYRKRAQGPHGWKNTNLRTTLRKTVRRAGLEPWLRTFHSLRASCETDLARLFPLAVVAKWLGNTQVVALRHYVDVTDTDFARASVVEASEPTLLGGRSANVLRRGRKGGARHRSKTRNPRFCRGLRGFAIPC